MSLADGNVSSPVRFSLDKEIMRLVKKYCSQKEISILDVGCGKGYYDYFQSAEVRGSYVGIDIDKI